MTATGLLALLYAFAVAGQFLDWRRVELICPAGPVTDHPITHRWVPPMSTCHYADGTTDQLVPTPVYVLMVVTLLVFLAGLWTALGLPPFATRRKRPARV